MQNAKVEEGAIMDKVIVDKGTIINEREVIRGTLEYPLTLQRVKLY